MHVAVAWPHLPAVSRIACTELYDPAGASDRLTFARPKRISNHFARHWNEVVGAIRRSISGGSMKPNFGAWQTQGIWWLHQACQRCGETVCLLIRTTAQLLIRMQDGPLWKHAHQFLTAISHWCEIQASKRRARYVGLLESS